MDYKLFTGRTVLKHGRNTNSLLGSKRFFGQMLAVRMKFDYLTTGSLLLYDDQQ